MVLRGTVRTYSDEVQGAIRGRMQALCDAMQLAQGVEVKLNYIKRCPALVNASDASVRDARASAQDVVGPERVRKCLPLTGAEDFAVFLKAVGAGCFIFVGASLLDSVPAEAASSPRPKTNTSQHHSVDFDFDERALGVGTRVYAALIHRLLGPQTMSSKL